MPYSLWFRFKMQWCRWFGHKCDNSVEQLGALHNACKRCYKLMRN